MAFPTNNGNRGGGRTVAAAAVTVVTVAMATTAVCASRGSSPSTASPRSSRAVVGSPSPRSSSSATATVASASATARPRKCRWPSRRAPRRPRSNLFDVPLAGSTIIHPVLGINGRPAGCMMKPAAPGTGVIAGGAARIILEEAGVHDVLCKSLGSANAHQRGPRHHRRAQVAAASRRDRGPPWPRRPRSSCPRACSTPTTSARGQIACRGASH